MPGQRFEIADPTRCPRVPVRKQRDEKIEHADDGDAPTLRRPEAAGLLLQRNGQPTGTQLQPGAS